MVEKVPHLPNVGTLSSLQGCKVLKTPQKDSLTILKKHKTGFGNILELDKVEKVKSLTRFKWSQEPYKEKQTSVAYKCYHFIFVYILIFFFILQLQLECYLYCMKAFSYISKLFFLESYFYWHHYYSHLVGSSPRIFKRSFNILKILFA